MIRMKLEKRKFDKALQEYLTVNKRDTAGLVEHTARKVVTGFSPRSASAHRVKGMRQGYLEKKAKKSKIRKEWYDRYRARPQRGTLRPPRYLHSKAAAGTYKSKHAALKWRTARGSGYVQATLLHKGWRPSAQPKNKVITTSLDKAHKGGGRGPATRTYIRTRARKPHVIWTSNVPGVVNNKYRSQVERRALRDARLDMMVYIKRKHQENKFGRN